MTNVGVCLACAKERPPVYHVILVNTRKRMVDYFTAFPLVHAEAVRIMGAQRRPEESHKRFQLEEVDTLAQSPLERQWRTAGEFST